MSDSLLALNPSALAVRRSSSVTEPPPDNQEQFLRLHLASTPALIPLHQIAEILTISSGQIVPIPGMPAWVLGIHNWRGEILWMVDLAYLCGLPPLYQRATNISAHKAIVLRIRENAKALTQAKGQLLGLGVDQVEDIEWCNLDEIQPHPHSTVTPELARFLDGFWSKSNDDMLAVLNGAAILAAMLGKG
jgi:positive phototaxis protein PixI